MDSAAVVLQQLPSVSYSRFSSSTQIRLLSNPVILHETKKIAAKFSNRGYLRYYNCESSSLKIRSTMCDIDAKDEAKKKMRKREKQQLKLMKRLSRNLSEFSGFGFEFDSGIEKDNSVISESARLLLENLTKIRTQKKELKKKMKQEKVKLKTNTAHNESSSSSSSDSSDSDSECEEVVNMKHLDLAQQTQTISPSNNRKCEEVANMKHLNLAQETQTISPSNNRKCEEVVNMKHLDLAQQTQTVSHSNNRKCEEVVNMKHLDLAQETQTIDVSIASSPEPFPATSDKKIEVCMGGKCKKNGAGAILEKFQTIPGIEGAVTGCKCMGKCRNGPIVKILNGDDGDDSVRIPWSSLCKGVGLEDVEAIAASFLDENHHHVSLSAAACLA